MGAETLEGGGGDFAHPTNFVVLALMGAEIAGGGGGADFAPPPPGRVILRAPQGGC
jgi:hypothetical protein